MVDKVTQFPRKHPYVDILRVLVDEITAAKRDETGEDKSYGLWNRYKWTRGFVKVTLNAADELHGGVELPTGDMRRSLVWGLAWRASATLSGRCILTKAFTHTYITLQEKRGVRVLH